MNNPEYIIVDVLQEVVNTVADANHLNRYINYQYGFVEELNETLTQFNLDPAKADKLFPLVWVQTPYSLRRGEGVFYGKTENLNIFVINACDINWKASERMANNYKPILYPIYRELMKQISYHPALASSGNGTADVDNITHRKIDYFYWGENQNNYLAYPVDVLQIGSIILKISNNPNCLPFKSLI